MDELIYSVKEVFSDFLRKELTGYYNIPEYQRGYKWNEFRKRVSVQGGMLL